MTIWRVGMKAVCVHRGKWRSKYGYVTHFRIWLGLLSMPIEKKVYTVIGVYDHDLVAGKIALRFAEFDPSVYYAAICFRPVVSKPTSIEVFQQILRDVSRRQPASVE